MLNEFFTLSKEKQLKCLLLVHFNHNHFQFHGACASQTGLFVAQIAPFGRPLQEQHDQEVRRSRGRGSRGS